MFEPQFTEEELVKRGTTLAIASGDGKVLTCGDIDDEHTQLVDQALWCKYDGYELHQHFRTANAATKSEAVLEPCKKNMASPASPTTKTLLQYV